MSRETVRGWMVAAKLWRAKPKRIEKVHTWRPRRSRRGELVQWDTSEHDWLEGRGPKLYLISMIDDATSRLLARFVEHDSTEENMRLLGSYLELQGRPLSFYTDKAAMFTTASKTKRGELAGKDRAELPLTQIGRALKELGIQWIAAHSPQAKGRVERGFGTAQDRLVKGLRVAQVKTLGAANAYLGKRVPALVEQNPYGQGRDGRRRTSPLGQAALPRRHTQSYRNAASRQRLHDSLREQAVSDCTCERLRRAARWHRACRKALGRGARCALPRPLSDGQRMRACAQSRCPTSNKAAQNSSSSQTERGQSTIHQWHRAFRRAARVESGAVQLHSVNLKAVGWANNAQPSSRLLYARPPLRSSTTVKLPLEARPSADLYLLNRGIAAVYSGANSIASALHLLNGRDPAENQSQSKSELSTLASKPDISTLRRIGHFYFALTIDAVLHQQR